jgi:hypothetical protein
MLYKVKDWIMENEDQLDWGTVFVHSKRKNCNIVGKYWQNFQRYYNVHPDMIDDIDDDTFSYDTVIELISRYDDCFNIVSTLPEQYWEELSANPAAIRLIEQNLDKICWSMLSQNSAAIHLLKNNMHKVDWAMLSKNPNAGEILCDNIDRVYMFYLCGFNENAGNIISTMIENDPSIVSKLHWRELTGNPNSVSLLEKYPMFVVWDTLPNNRGAFQFLKKNTDKLSENGWGLLATILDAPTFTKHFPDKTRYLPLNPYSDIMHEIYNGSGSVNISSVPRELLRWDLFSSRSKNHTFLRENIENIDWRSFSMNPTIYDYDYAGMKQNMNVLREELMMKAWHPSRVFQWIDNDCDSILE